MKIFRQSRKNQKITQKFPPNDLKTEKLTSKMKIKKKMKIFKIFRKSGKKIKIAPKIHQNDQTMSPKMFKLKKRFFLNLPKCLKLQPD